MHSTAAIQEVRRTSMWQPAEEPFDRESVVAIVSGNMSAHDANKKYGERYGIDWKYADTSPASPSTISP